MPQFLIDSKDVQNNEISIYDKENYNHIVKSLRIKVGEKLSLIDENQIRYDTKVKEITTSNLLVTVENKYKSDRKLDFKLYLAQVPLRNDAQSTIIEKATELGCDGVFPILGDNCALSKDIIEKKLPKWQKIMFESFKQCERAYVPKCYNYTTLEDIIKMKNDFKIIAYCEKYTNHTLHNYFKNNPLNKDDKIIVIIGPEGGFSKREFELFEINNIPMITLGKLILRAETAVITGLGNLIYEYNIEREN